MAQIDYSTRQARISALAPDDPGRPLWSFALEPSELPRRVVWSGRGAFARERVLVALEDGVIALDARDGSLAWRFGAGPNHAERIFAAEGVALVLLERQDKTYRVQALDAWAGTPLWNADISDPAFDSWPILAHGLAVFLPSQTHRDVRALDLFTGRLAFELELPYEVKDIATTREGPWYEDGKLILPWFRQDDQPALVALDLARGSVAWQAAVESPDGLPRELEAIVQHAERTFLVVRAGAGRGRTAQFSEIRELRSALPAISNPIGNLRLALDDKLMGVDDRRRVQLATPEVFVCSPVRGEEATRLRQVHLAYGEGWSHVLGLAREFIPSGMLPLPAVSDSAVAFCFTEYKANNQVRPETRLLFLDRGTGQTRDKRTLMEDLGQHDDVELWPIGDVLIVSGDKRMEILR